MISYDLLLTNLLSMVALDTAQDASRDRGLKSATDAPHGGEPNSKAASETNSFFIRLVQIPRKGAAG